VSEQLRVDSAEERAAREAELQFERARSVLTPLYLNRAQLGRAWEAFQNFPAGVTRIAREAQCGRVPAALFMAKLTAGDHENGTHIPKPRPTAGASNGARTAEPMSRIPRDGHTAARLLHDAWRKLDRTGHARA